MAQAASVPHKFGPSALLGGWVVSGTAFARTGLPFTVVDSNAFGILQGFNYGFTNITSVSVPANSSGTGGQTCSASAANPAIPCLVASNFSPAVNGFGQQRRNQFTGLSYFNTDLAVTKNFKIPHWEGALLGIGASSLTSSTTPTSTSLMQILLLQPSAASSTQSVRQPASSVLSWERTPRRD